MSETKKPRGFAALHPARVSELARKGGQTAHKKLVNGKPAAHQFTSEEARLAGAKGGRASHAKKRAAKLAPAGTVSGNEAKGGKMVEVMCSSASGCAGIVKAGTPEAAEAIGKPFTPKGASEAPKGPSADEDPDNMGGGHCGSAGCGSH